MNIKKAAFFISGVLLFIFHGLLFAQEEKEERISQFIEENAICLKCHNNHTFEYYNKYAFKTAKKLMCDNYRIDSALFYESNHWSFACIDCHSSDYEHYPHPEEARMEEAWNCIDCHGYDENYAHYHFEDIELEFQQSAHVNANGENFTCWKCHDPHTYKISARTNENILHTIAYDNSICLNCHADFDQFQLLTNKESIDIFQHHEWLPNRELHFNNIRCIECHTQINDSILVAHLILPKEEAVKRCTECHSQDSRLLSTLYKFQSKEGRSKYGFVNSAILNRAYVIGANRNYVLNKISVLILIGTLGLIILHSILRVIFKRK